jgi:hypothetical protein
MAKNIIELIATLVADDDAGEPIGGVVRFAQQNWGTHLVKRMTDVYLTAREADGVSLDVIADETTEWRYQTPPGAGPRHGAHKVKIGRGVVFHTAGLVLRNRNGGAFSVGGIEVLVEPLSRRIS